MAKPDQEAAPGAAEQQTETLQEFCRNVSLADRRVELIGAFHADETRAGHAHATRAEWTARYAAFQARPVS